MFRFSLVISATCLNNFLTDFVVHFREEEFGLAAAEHVVLGLLDDWRYAVELATVGPCLHDLDGGPP